MKRDANDSLTSNFACLSCAVVGGNIFQLEKLLIPINVNKSHWILAMVDMSQHQIHIYDSLPSKKNKGGTEYISFIESYLEAEFNELPPATMTKPQWTGVPCPVGSTHVPKQRNSYDCGLFVCFFMDLTMSKCPVTSISQDIIKDYGREWLCLSLLNHTTVF
jgi:sentrin-specific protease 1